MCGIYLIKDTANTKLVNFMGNILMHRGPDDYGTYYNSSVSLGHRRLSIIDVEGGRQPIFNEGNDKCIICNGEIYNYKSLRNELASSHKFSTRSDTEVLLHLYEQFGPAMLNKLNGMFALIICDNGEIFAARDRLGIKPLYYAKFKGKDIEICIILHTYL